MISIEGESHGEALRVSEFVTVQLNPSSRATINSAHPRPQSTDHMIINANVDIINGIASSATGGL